ncbi:GNAT family N-acetyltransferase [Candidatus Regiella insecticola]|nr:GNAT family N-acetyltransferase [Candidatus Regiella insecticola]
MNEIELARQIHLPEAISLKEISLIFNKMNAEEFKSYAHDSIKNYANSLLQGSAKKPADILREATDDFTSLLPYGINTTGHNLNVIVDAKSQERLGIVWYAIEPRESCHVLFIYDIDVVTNQRRKGIATRIINDLMAKITHPSILHVELSVFIHNKVAINLYKKLGFSPIEISALTMTMRKPIL